METTEKEQIEKGKLANKRLIETRIKDFNKN